MESCCGIVPGTGCFLSCCSVGGEADKLRPPENKTKEEESPMLILAFESSCDETAVAVVED